MEELGSYEKPRLTSTYRPIELMFAVTGKDPGDFKGKSILNVGAGKTHWGFELTRRYGVVPRKFENFDIVYGQRSLPRRMIGRLFMAESVGDVKRKLPYEDKSFDIVWSSYAPVNWDEFLRVAKPGAEIFVLGGDLDDQRAKKISAELGMKVICKEVAQKEVDKWKERTDSRYRSAVDFVAGKKTLVLKKPEMGE